MRRLAVVGFAALVALAIGATALFTADLEPARAAARHTARWSLVWFLIAYFVATLARRGRELSEGERLGWLGLCAAHLVHLGFVFHAIAASDFPFIPLRAAGGALAYALLVTIAYGAHRGARWATRAADLGGLWIGFVFFETYRSRLAHPELAMGAWSGHLVLVIVVAAAVVVRWAVLLARSR